MNKTHSAVRKITTIPGEQIKLAASHKAVLLALATRTNEQGKDVYPGIAMLTRETKLSRIEVIRTLKDIEEWKLVSAIHRKGQRTLYTVDIPLQKRVLSYRKNIVDLVQRTALPRCERMILEIIAAHSNAYGSSSYPCIDTIAKESGYAKSTVYRAILHLKTCGFLEPITCPGKKGDDKHGWRIPYSGTALVGNLEQLLTMKKPARSGTGKSTIEETPAQAPVSTSESEREQEQESEHQADTKETPESDIAPAQAPDQATSEHQAPEETPAQDCSGRLHQALDETKEAHKERFIKTQYDYYCSLTEIHLSEKPTVAQLDALERAQKTALTKATLDYDDYLRARYEQKKSNHIDAIKRFVSTGVIPTPESEREQDTRSRIREQLQKARRVRASERKLTAQDIKNCLDVQKAIMANTQKRIAFCEKLGRPAQEKDTAKVDECKSEIERLEALQAELRAPVQITEHQAPDQAGKKYIYNKQGKLIEIDDTEDRQSLAIPDYSQAAQESEHQDTTDSEDTED